MTMLHQFLYGLKRKNPVKYRRTVRVTVAMLIFFIIIVCLIYTEANIMPRLLQLARYKTNSIAVRAINNAISVEIKDSQINYSNIASLVFDNNGKIIAIETDTVRLNMLKTQITESVEEVLSSPKSQKVKIPSGSFTGIGILSGRGPSVTVKTVPLGIIDVNYENIFTSAGINQTRHQIFINITVDMQIFLPSGKQEVETVKTSVCVAETIIVGEVPEFFAGSQ